MKYTVDRSKIIDASPVDREPEVPPWCRLCLAPAEGVLATACLEGCCSVEDLDLIPLCRECAELPVEFIISAAGDHR
jgi:hypothetical protein